MNLTQLYHNQGWNDWKATKETDVRGNPTWRVDSNRVYLIATLSYTTRVERDLAEPTARIIEAAPELLNRCIVMLRQFDGLAVRGKLSAAMDLGLDPLAMMTARPFINRIPGQTGVRI